MYEIQAIKDPKIFDVYYYTTKNEAGQILYLEFYGEETNKHRYYYIRFQIGKRKQGYKFLEQTGKDGLRSLLWAKNCIKDFIQSIEKRNNYGKTDEDLKWSIVVSWDNNRRRNTYFRGLKSLKFYYGMYFGKKVLIKDIN